MSANNSSSSQCWTYPLAFTSTAQFIAYKFLIPVYLLTDLIGRSLFLAAVYKRSKKEHTYFYQVVRAVVEFVQVPFRALICLYDAIWGTATFGLPAVIAQSYGAMWLFSKIIFVMSCFSTLTISLAVCMAADRVFALANSQTHQHINHRKHRTVAVSVCFFQSLALGIVDFFRFDILEIPGGGGYTFAFSPVMSSSLVVYGLGLCRTIAQTSLTVLLFVLSGILLYYYRVKFVSSDAVKVGAFSEEAKKRKQSEKVLLMLTLLECSFMLVEKSILTLAAIFVYVFPAFYVCIKPVWLVIDDGVLMLNDLVDFYASFAISKQFRAMVKKVFPDWFWNEHSNEVVPL